MYIYPMSILFFSFLLFAGFLTPTKALKIPQISSNLASLRNDYAKESQRVMAAIRAEFAISQGIWDRYMDDFKALVAHDNLRSKGVKVRSKALIPRLLEEYGINKSHVRIQKMDGTAQAEAFQDIEENHIIHRLGVNFNWLKTRPANEQEAILRHEIQHLLNYDSIEEMYIRWILIDSGYTQDDWKSSTSMTDYYHLRELRADAFGCACHKKVAQSLHDYFCDTMNSDEDTIEWYTHPRDTVRAHQLALLHNLDSRYLNLA